MATQKPGQDTLVPLHSYHIILTNGDERDIKGGNVAVDAGALVIRNAQGAHVVTYAAGQWVLCEMERQDDK